MNTRQKLTMAGCGLMSLLFTGSVLAQPLDDDEKAGTIQIVDLMNDSITVKLDEDNSIEEYSIDEDTDIRVDDERFAELDDLKPGDRIVLNFEEDVATQRRVTRRLGREETPADKRAEVLDVDTASDELTVRFLESGDRETYYIASDTDIWVDGRRSDLGDVKEGDRVILDFEDRDNRPTIRWITYEIVPVATPVVRNNTVANNQRVASNQRVAVLPDTASPVPFIGLAGLVFMSLAGLARRKRVS